ncbi:hypothetical protein Q7P37_004160 [Cladosporium fusiforme]
MSATSQSPPKETSPLGPIVRLRNRDHSELPSHPALPPASGTARPTVAEFIAAVLTEADSFMTSYLPNTFKTKSKDKHSPPSTAPVELLSREVQSSEIPASVRPKGSNCTAETWFARTSIHENAAKNGTASWEEFDKGTRANHCQREDDYTPDVLDAHLVFDWSEELGKLDKKVGDWEDVGAEVREMLHNIPPPLNDRVFTVMCIWAKRPAKNDWLVVQLPVSPRGLPGVKYQDRPKITTGQYVSVERGELVDGGKNVKWQMGTASDAGGILPQWAQNLGVPGAVVKDVGLFIEYCEEQRAGKA